ncbi:hypothetical protein D3C72_2036840 [compost metagenome]
MLRSNEIELVARPGAGQQRLDVSLHVVEVDIVATMRPVFRQPTTANHPGQHRLLLQPFQLTNETQATFKQAHTRLLTIEVVLQRLDQARP